MAGTIRLQLAVLDGLFAICKLPVDDPIPNWACTGDFCSITRTADELSIVCRQDQVPLVVVCERDWRCLRVAGSMPFSVVGVMDSLVAPLAAAGISLFAISTFDTDYLLMKSHSFASAVAVLRRAGHCFCRTPVADES